MRVGVPFDRHLLVGHEQPGGHQLGVEPRAHQEVVVGAVAASNVAVEGAVLPEEEPGRVAKEAGWTSSALIRRVGGGTDRGG